MFAVSANLNQFRRNINFTYKLVSKFDALFVAYVYNICELFEFLGKNIFNLHKVKENTQESCLIVTIANIYENISVW